MVTPRQSATWRFHLVFIPAAYQMKLKRFLLRYYPPGESLQLMNFLLENDGAMYCLPSGILLEYEQSGQIKSKSIDFLDLRPEYVCLLALLLVWVPSWV